MTGAFVNPSYKRPSRQSLETLLNSFKREILKELNCVKVGVIQAYDPGNATRAPNVNVEIAFTQVTSIAPDGTRTLAQYPLLFNVPVSFQQGGGCIATFPIAQGDECLVLFNDRQIDTWLLSSSGQPPDTGRLHDLSDGFAIVGVRSDPRGIAGISTTTAQLRSIDGNNYVEVDPTGHAVNVVAGAAINMTAPTINFNASTEVNLSTPQTNIEGVLTGINSGSAPSGFTVNGAIVATGNVTGNGISLDSHRHTGVMTGGGDTGGPI